MKKPKKHNFCYFKNLLKTDNVVLDQNSIGLLNKKIRTVIV